MSNYTVCRTTFCIATRYGQVATDRGTLRRGDYKASQLEGEQVLLLANVAPADNEHLALLVQGCGCFPPAAGISLSMLNRSTSSKTRLRALASVMSEAAGIT